MRRAVLVQAPLSLEHLHFRHEGERAKLLLFIELVQALKLLIVQIEYRLKILDPLFDTLW